MNSRQWRKVRRAVERKYPIGVSIQETNPPYRTGIVAPESKQWRRSHYEILLCLNDPKEAAGAGLKILRLSDARRIKRL